MSPEESRELVSAQRGSNVEQRMITSGALEIHERRLREVVVPRRSVVTLAVERDVVSARAELVGSGHSRAPVARGGGIRMTWSAWCTCEICCEMTCRWRR